METKSATSVPSAVSALCSSQTLATAGWPGRATSDGGHELWYQLRDTAPRACQLVGRDDSLARLFLLVGLDLARYIQSSCVPSVPPFVDMDRPSHVVWT